MPVHDHHEKPYDVGTLDKLELYKGYVKEWLPVFLHQQHIKTINLFDFFAGPGADLQGTPGSPQIAFNEVTHALASRKIKSILSIRLHFNEFDPEKHSELVSVLNALPPTDHVHIEHECLDFDQAFDKWYPLMKKPRVANLIFVDQNGVKHFTEKIFEMVLALSRTDLLFFISSSMVNRFKSEGSIIKRVPVSESDLSRMNGSNVHRIVAESYRRLVPQGKTYFLAPFSIKKGANVYGLIFGSQHPLGMDKFLRQCWKRDEVRGEANFDIDGEGIIQEAPSLFEDMNKPKKIAVFEGELSSAILNRTLKTNKDIYVYSLERGFLGTHAKRLIDDLIEANKLPKQTLHVS